jgi:phosphohistidine phosphatase
MKTVTFIRHAKSSWDSGASRDIDRPLNSRGKKDAPFMAAKLKTLGYQPDGFLISPAKRISQTVAPFIKLYGVDENEVITEHKIYHGSMYDILDTVQQLPSSWNHVFLFCHNPAITNIAYYFGGDIDNVPTCGVVKVSADIDNWTYFDSGNAKVNAFLYPKMFDHG